jgi:hypothetical protein
LRRPGREKQDCIDCTGVQSFGRGGVEFGHGFGGVQSLPLQPEAGVGEIAGQISGDDASRCVEQASGCRVEPGFDETSQTFHIAVSTFDLNKAFVARRASRGITDRQNGQAPDSRTRCGSPYAICACEKQGLYAIQIERRTFLHPDFQHGLDHDREAAPDEFGGQGLRILARAGDQDAGRLAGHVADPLN